MPAYIKRKALKSSVEKLKRTKLEKLKEKFDNFYNNLKRSISKLLSKIDEKGKQRLTIMFVPHNEKKIINIQISNYILFTSLFLLIITVSASIIAISNNQQTYKQVVRLKDQNENKKLMIEEYKKSIESVSKRFTIFKVDVNNILKSMGKDKNIYNVKEIVLNDELSNTVKPKEVSELEKLKLELDITKENIRRMGFVITEINKLLKELPSIYPLALPSRYSSLYGYRIDPVYRWKVEFHTGLDMAGVIPGTPVFAAADGKVSLATWMGGYGFLVEIKHKYGFATRYAHLSRFASGIYPGVFVKQGQTIGYVGTTGKSTGYHLHYEVRIGEQTVDPEPYVSMLLP